MQTGEKNKVYFASLCVAMLVNAGFSCSPGWVPFHYVLFFSNHHCHRHLLAVLFFFTASPSLHGSQDAARECGSPTRNCSSSISVGGHMLSGSPMVPEEWWVEAFSSPSPTDSAPLLWARPWTRLCELEATAAAPGWSRESLRLYIV